MIPAINPAHPYAVYEYTDEVNDKYYRGKRFISANDPALCHHTKIVATGETVEECQQHLPPVDLGAWLRHSLMETMGMTP